MRIEKLTSHIGAEIVGIDLAEAVTNDDLFGTIREALLAHKVLFLRDQLISKAQHVAFATRFGELEDHPVVGSDPDHPGLVCIYKDLDSPADHFENAWHCDATWRESPPMGAVLRCLECPPVGGDTVWANMARAYEDLSDHVKEQIDGLMARHSIEATFGARMPIEKRHGLKEQFPDAEHPVVRTHPETGEKVLFVNSFTTHFTNFHTERERPLRPGLRPGRVQPAQPAPVAGFDPRISGSLALAAEQRRDLGQPLHAALRRHGLLARRPENGARRDQGGQAVLSRAPPAERCSRSRQRPRRAAGPYGDHAVAGVANDRLRRDEFTAGDER